MFSRKTTKSMSRGPRFFSGQSRSSSSLTGRWLTIEIELEPGTEQDVARVPVVGYARVAQRAEEDGVELPQRVVAVRRHRNARLEIVVGAPRQVLEIETPAKGFGDRPRTLTASAVTSLPMPSPGMIAMFIS